MIVAGPAAQVPRNRPEENEFHYVCRRRVGQPMNAVCGSARPTNSAGVDKGSSRSSRIPVNGGRFVWSSTFWAIVLKSSANSCQKSPGGTARRGPVCLGPDRASSDAGETSGRQTDCSPAPRSEITTGKQQQAMRRRPVHRMPKGRQIWAFIGRFGTVIKPQAKSKSIIATKHVSQ